MKQLTGMDMSFLLMETPTMYGHVNGLSIYERPSPDFDPFTAVRERLKIMTANLEPLRRKLVEVPFELDRPYWIEDRDFDIDYHVRHLGLAPPGYEDQLGEQVARIVGRHLDRSRPLWEAYVIEGLADGRWALLHKLHHATIDGASGVLVLKMFTDLAPEAEWPYHDIPWDGEDPPSRGELLQRAAKNLALNPVRGMRVGLGIMRDLADAAGVTSVSGFFNQARSTVGQLARRNADDGSSQVTLPLTPAPETPWTKAITPHRRFAMRAVQLENIKVLKQATGGTINDVVMAVCAGALREYLLEKDALPDRRLRAMVPVSIRTGEEEDPWTNRVAAIVAELPTDVEDPLDRVAECCTHMTEAKHQFDLVPAESLVDLTQYTPPVLAASAVRLVSRVHLADRMNLPVNVVISNVPGPRETLWCSGAKLDEYIPVSTISEGVGLNITVHSYEDRMVFGLIADRELVPDVWHLIDLHIDELERLREAAGIEWVEPLPAPGPRAGGDGVEPIPPDPEQHRLLHAAAAGRTMDATRATGTQGSRKAAGTKTAKKGAAGKRAGKKASARTSSRKQAAS